MLLRRPGFSRTASLLMALSPLQAAAAAGNPDGLVILSFSVGSAQTGTALRNGTNSTLEPDADMEERRLVSLPVSLSFRTVDGERIPMPALAKPIDLLIPGGTAAAQCAFWDEDTATWSTKGLLRPLRLQSRVICQLVFCLPDRLFTCCCRIVRVEVNTGHVNPRSHSTCSAEYQAVSL